MEVCIVSNTLTRHGPQIELNKGACVRVVSFDSGTIIVGTEAALGHVTANLHLTVAQAQSLIAELQAGIAAAVKVAA